MKVELDIEELFFFRAFKTAREYAAHFEVTYPTATRRIKACARLLERRKRVATEGKTGPAAFEYRVRKASK